MPDAVFLEEMENPVSRRGEPVEISSPPAQVAFWGRMLAMLATLTTHPLVAFSVAGVLTLVFGLLGGGGVAFRHMLALTSHAMLIPAAGTLLSTILRLSAGISFEGSWVDAILGDGAPGGVFGGVLSRLDPFILWSAIAAGIAMHELDPRRSRFAAAVIIIGLYVMLVVGSAMLAA
jgi:hypothetical protein